MGRSAIVAEWAAGKVLRVPLDGTRGSPGTAANAMPFLTGIQNPVPVLLTPAGVLLVGDWASGTVYAISPLSAS